MGKVVRAIVINGDQLLVMRRSKQGNEYYTLVGGKINDNEDPKQALIREVKEETGLDVTSSRLVFVEEHPEPYNEQRIYLCQVKESGSLAIQSGTDEAILNLVDIETHEPIWIGARGFDKLAFRTPQLQSAIAKALIKGFPENPQNI